MGDWRFIVNGHSDDWRNIFSLDSFGSSRSFSGTFLLLDVALLVVNRYNQTKQTCYRVCRRALKLRRDERTFCHREASYLSRIYVLLGGRSGSIALANIVVRSAGHVCLLLDRR